jgi:hypothetical protein
MRVARRQKVGRALKAAGYDAILVLRCAITGATLPVTLRRGVLESSGGGGGGGGSGGGGSSSSSSWQLGDLVSVVGAVERSAREDRMSLHARLLHVDEAWSATFGARAVFCDVEPPACLHSALLLAARGTAPTIALLCVASHTARMQAHLEAQGATQVVALPPVSAPHANEERCLLLRAPPGAGSGRDAEHECAAYAASLLADPACRRFLQRSFILGSAHGSLDQLTAEVARRLRGDCAVRLHAYPRSLEAALVPRLRASGAMVAPSGGAACYVEVVYAYGGYALGVHAKASPSIANTVAAPAAPASLAAAVVAAAAATAGDDVPPTAAPASAAAPPPAVAASVSRAYHKLRELGARTGLELAVGRAIDVGACPGGWTSCLVSDDHSSFCHSATLTHDGGRSSHRSRRARARWSQSTRARSTSPPRC